MDMAKLLVALWISPLLTLLLLRLGQCSQDASGDDNDSRRTTKPLFIATLLPYPDSRPGFRPSWDERLEIIPAMDLAARQVNQRQGFLDGYELRLVHHDGGCNINTKTFMALARLLSSVESVLGMIGPGCSASTLTSLPLLNRTSLIAVHGAGSPEINRTSFPNSFGTYGSSIGFVEAIFAMMERASWRNISLLSDPSRPFFSDTVNFLQQDLPRAHPDARILYSSPVYDFYLPVADIKETLVRVVLLFTGPELARKVMCIAFHEEMFYPAYQWVIIGRILEEFTSTPVYFQYDSILYNCSTDDFARILEDNFLLNFKLSHFQDDEEKISGVSYQEYVQQYNASVMAYNLENSNNTIEFSMWATYFYDAVWAWAVVLDNATKSGNFSIEEYQFDQPNDALIEQFEQVDFEGVSGRIKFDRETGSVDRIVDIFLISNTTEEYVAYCNAGALVELTDGLEFVEDAFLNEITIHPASVILIWLPLFVQVVVVIATHIVVVVKRDFKSIKASSPKINHLAYVGVYFLITGFFFSTISYLLFLDEREGIMCQAVWAFFLPYGFTLAFGTAIVRTWRLYRIFTHYLNPGKLITEPALFSIVFSMLALDVVVSIIWTSTDPLVQTLTIIPSQGGIRQYCRSQYFFVWLVFVTGYRALQLAVLLTLGCLTRNIRNKSFQTVTLQVLVYGTVIVFGLGATLYYFALLLELNNNITYVILGAIVNALLLLYLSCVFMPPIIPLIKHKWNKSGYELRRVRFRKSSQTEPLAT